MTTEAMNVFLTTSATFLGQYSTGLPKDTVMSALSGELRYDELHIDSEFIATTAVLIMESFTDQDYSTHGIHRVAGSKSTQMKALNSLKCALNKQMKEALLRDLRADDKAGCLRTILRDLPDTIFPYCQREVLLDFGGMLASTDQPETIARVVKALRILIYYMPEPHKQCLCKLLPHFRAISSRAETNHMGVDNLAIIFCPILFPMSTASQVIETVKENMGDYAKIFSLLIDPNQDLFSLPDEVLDTLSSTMKAVNSEESPEQYASTADAEVMMSVSYVDRNATPLKPSTEFEMAKLMANVYSMPDDEEKRKMIKSLQKSQRKALGVQSKPRIPFMRILK